MEGGGTDIGDHLKSRDILGTNKRTSAPELPVEVVST